jgi:signal transduction histidine kinase
MNNNKLSVLLVDDEPEIIEMFEVILEKEKYTILKALSAEEAMELIDGQEFDIIVSDMRMTGATGLDVLKYINKKKHRSKFIIQTAYATVDIAIQAMKKGAYDFITKPVNLIHFKAIIEKCRTRILTEVENRQLKSDNLRLEELNEIKEKFIAITNHEIRTPLTILKGYTDLMEMYTQEYDDPDIKTTITTIKSTLKDLEFIAQRMHNISRFNVNKEESSPAKLELFHVVETVVEQLKIVIKDRELDLLLKRPKDYAYTFIDEHHLKIAVSEVIQNSIKFTKDGGKISISFQLEDDFVELHIKDNGIGISEDSKDKIFQIFYEAQDVMNHSTSKSKFMGSSLGIGLSLVKDICEKYGIHYRLDSELEKGTEFTFRFRREK